MTLMWPNLEDMGAVLWGEAWRAPLAESLGVTEDELRFWEATPSTMPRGIDLKIQELCSIRIEEIDLMREHLKTSGIARANA